VPADDPAHLGIITHTFGIVHVLKAGDGGPLSAACKIR
jgi:hypothetical protein